ncbi:TRAFAC clade GTPase domain-containing protein [Desertihabitans aurantiacus]|uniref:TRAFAC clade GTPase domain-containing protein n=1 Tax=Desertihabitans aurantiacus TaxID=2282477 RepID=UPI000DF77B48|nr:GTPase domain-containing protein [Desertihabitans aurantiacus]
MSKCPMCFFAIPEDVASYACRACPPEHNQRQAACAGLTSVTWPVVTELVRDRQQSGVFSRRWPPTSVACHQCQRPATEQVCPTCHYLLPEDWRDSDTLCVALAGARNTGKSLYLGVAVQQLGLMLQSQGVALQHGTVFSQQSYERHYEEPLFSIRQMPQATPRAQTEDAAQRHPLVLSLGTRHRRRRYLVLRDAAGEELQNPPERALHLSYFDRADAVLFMFDPAADPAIAALLPDVVQRGVDQGSAARVLANVLRLSGEHRPPVGVVVSKFDLLQRLTRVEAPQWQAIMGNAGAAMQRDPGVEVMAYQRDDAELLSAEVHSLLTAMRARDVINQLANPHDGRLRTSQFFAVSALGASAVDSGVHPHGIASFRCLDPLRWALAQADLVDVA